jgi:hypothetical protein
MDWEYRTTDIYDAPHYGMHLERNPKTKMENHHFLEHNYSVDSLIVAFYNSDTEIVVDFEPGISNFTSIRKINTEEFYICSKGQLHFFPPNEPGKARTFQAICMLQGKEYIQSINTLVCWDDSDFFAVRGNESLWGNVRVAYDGIKEVKVCDSKIIGKGWSAPKNKYLPFELDIADGKLLSEPIYQISKR